MSAASFEWTGRRVFVTGATGIVGSWLVKRLLDHSAHVVTLVRDWDPQTELVRSGDILRTNVVNGRLEDYDTLERAINEHEILSKLAAKGIALERLTENELKEFDQDHYGDTLVLITHLRRDREDPKQRARERSPHGRRTSSGSRRTSAPSAVSFASKSS